jgi:hypothetical protein
MGSGLVVAVDDVHPVGTGLSEERRQFVRALATPHDEDARSGQAIEPHEVAGVAADAVGDRRCPVGEDLGGRHAGCGHAGVGANPRAARRDGLELAVHGAHVAHPVVPHDDPLLRLEPGRVREEDVDGDGIDVLRRDPLVVQEGLEGVDAGRIEVPVDRRTEVHARGHVVGPEAQRPAEDDGVDPPLDRSSGGGQPVGARSDDEE